MPEFVGGLRLSGRFYEEAVAPVIASAFPGLVYSAARIGSGSEVLGYDTDLSTDHEWGPRLQLFLAERDHRSYAGRIVTLLSRELPPEFMGYSTHFGEPDEEGVQIPEKASGPVNHKVEVHTVRRFFESWTGLDPCKELEPTDWLLVPQQKLLEVTAGRVYHDGLGELEDVRARLAYYPEAVWLCLLAAQWWRISQQEAFVGRTGEVGDELGSKLIAANLVHDLMRLCFLMEKRYAPYSKWFGTAFARLECAGALIPIFERVLRADHWKEREEHLIRAYEYVACMHNALGITTPIETRVSRYHDRPFLVIHADRFARAIEAAIEDPEVGVLRARFGSVDQFVDSTDVLSRPAVYGRLRAMYGAW
ncbi:MAG: DUF4037 domain-containing protein [Rubrobacter sp.]